MNQFKAQSQNEGSTPFTRSLLNQRLAEAGGQEGDMEALGGVRLRDYQIPAVERLSGCERGICKAPAGSGKTIIAAAALERWVGRRIGRSRVIWVANTVDQLDQARRAVALFPGIAQFAAVDFACYAGVASLAGYDLAIFDECHHVAAPGFAPKLGFYGGPRWGLSATPDRADDLKAVVYALLGDIVHEVPREALVDARQLAQARVVIHAPNRKAEMEAEIREAAMPEYEKRKKKWPNLFRFKEDADKQKSRCTWQFALNIGIQANQKRNAQIVELAIRHAEDSTLIIVGSIEHGLAIAAQVAGAEVCYAKLGAKKRRAMIAAFAAGELKTMVATSLADEGLDVPRANVLILAAAGRSAAKAEQRTGRVLRAFHDKEHGTIHDFADLQHYFLAAQARQRIAVYRSLGYTITEVAP